MQGYRQIAFHQTDPAKAVAAVLLVSIVAFLLVLGAGHTADSGQDEDYRVRIMALIDAGELDSALADLSEVI